MASNPQIRPATPTAAVKSDDIGELFGGARQWSSEQWIASDDRVRGGKSQSYVRISNSADTATFYGNLDITALGGAGFASQRTTSAAGGPWDLSATSGLYLGVDDIDDRIYTLVVKDTILPKRPDGREQSTLSYEFSFSIRGQSTKASRMPGPLQNQSPSDLVGRPFVLALPDRGPEGDISTLPVTLFIPWANFRPYYRGKKKPDAGSLDTSKVQRLSIMCRSMFGLQHGDFSIAVKFLSTLTITDQTFDSQTVFYQLSNIDCGGNVENFYVLYTSVSHDAPGTPQSRADTDDKAEWDFIEDMKELLIEEEATASSGKVEVGALN
ncbi:hypothetical protein DRE_00040 [Drechslerella stenobrocha 248]|uniref:NADH:ubiquinone oxidoreductase intermediate-associated protein 30 domain-containing protein n=1 Tax=Drechslerella stenobrocha 248 TaxID=1043628 RepID=W7IHK3_9PEZI|nr:hypothetical protein DRE_00040 [Drechslerella stenobrocha 248]